MMEKFAIVIAEMPAEIFLVAKGPVAFAALEGAVLVVDDFDVTLEVAASGETGVAQVAGVRSFMSMRLQMSFERIGFHYSMARQTFDACSFSLAHHYGPHLDTSFTVFFKFFQIICVLQKSRTIQYVTLMSRGRNFLE